MRRNIEDKSETFQAGNSWLHFFLFFASLVVVLVGIPAGAAQVTLAWDEGTGADLAGYIIYYGTASRNYSVSVDVGRVTTHTVTGLSEGFTYYFAATAYDTSHQESAYSNEVAKCVWAGSGSSVSTYADTIQKLYIVYCQRPADPGGLLYWAGELSASGGNLTDIIEAFANSAESQALYGPIDSSNIETVVDSIYMAFFGRHADAEGVAYYVNRFNARGVTPATILWDIINGAQDEDLVSINNRVAAANSSLCFTW